jgi:NAD(P)-dependent dehydrogenase (short-subunit alcohol dehydrogenase family)
MANSLKGKNIIITGANAGIGYETALELTKRGYIKF